VDEIAWGGGSQLLLHPGIDLGRNSPNSRDFDLINWALGF